jgi:CubicO group peptidase (beta-lactamase class C family)
MQVSPELTPNLHNLPGAPAEQREEFIKRLLQEEPIVKPGTESRYSNAGYALVGFVAAQGTGKSWETLMTEEVFKPLSMATAGFGRPRTKDRPHEPWLHQWTGEQYEPESEHRVNVMEALAPAGNVHCSIRDFAKFAAYELSAARGNNRLLSMETANRFRELSRFPAGGSRSGPPMKTRPGDSGKSPKVTKGPKAGKSGPAGGNAFFGGSAFISSGCMLWPDKYLAAVVAVNAGGAHAAIREIFQEVEKNHG